MIAFYTDRPSGSICPLNDIPVNSVIHYLFTPVKGKLMSLSRETTLTFWKQFKHFHTRIRTCYYIYLKHVHGEWQAAMGFLLNMVLFTTTTVVLYTAGTWAEHTYQVWFQAKEEINCKHWKIQSRLQNCSSNRVILLTFRLPYVLQCSLHFYLICLLFFCMYLFSFSAVLIHSVQFSACSPCLFSALHIHNHFLS